MEDTQLEDSQLNDSQQQNNLPSVPEQQDSTSNPDDSPKKRFNLPRNVIFVFSIISLCFVILFGISWSNGKINELNTKISDIETQLNKAQEQYENIKFQLEDEKSKNKDLSEQLDNQKNEVFQWYTKYSEIESENTKLKEEINSLKSQLEQAKAASIQSTTYTSTTSYDTSTNIPSEPVGSMVWITQHGKKYHSKPDCGRSNPNTSYQVTLSEAQSMGYPPCKKCY